MKALLIAWKDLILIFRDRTALMLMLVAPLVLTIGIAMVSGRLGGASGPTLQNIPVALVNRDNGEIGAGLVEAFASPGLSSLLNAQLAEDESTARRLVEEDKVAAAVIIPAGFSEAITGGENETNPAQIEVYANPAREISSGVVSAVVETFLQRVELGRVSGALTVELLLAEGWINPQQAGAIGLRAGSRAADPSSAETRIRLRTSSDIVAKTESFDAMSYFAPSFAILFLMYTVALGGRSLLQEKESGTMARLASSPARPAAILGGKMLGIYLMALAQMVVLLLANSILFGVRFGDPVALAALVMVLAAAASGWGALLAALARTPGQISSLGMAMMLTFGVLGGSFMPTSQMPEWFRWIGKITPNAWGLEGFVSLGYGDGLADIAGKLAGLACMAAVLFVVSVVLLQRRRILLG